MVERIGAKTYEAGKVLITGGTGLIGSALLPRLLAEYSEVYVVSRDRRHVPAGAIPIVTDISESNWLLKCMDVVKDTDHLIWMAYSISQEERKNRQITFNGLVDAVRLLPVQSIIFVGTIGVYGNDPAPGVYSEESLKVGDIAYAKSKIAAVEFLQGESTQRSVTVLHPSNVYARQSRRVEYYRKLLASGYLLYEKDGSGFYNVVHSDDVADAIMRALKRDVGAEFEEYIVNGETLEFRDWIGAIEKRFQYDKRKSIPRAFYPVCRGPIRRFLSPFGYRLPAKIPSDKARLFEKQVMFSSEKIKNHLCWQPSRLLPGSLL